MQGTVTRLRTNLGERANLFALVCDVYCDFVFPFDILGHVWYLIVSIPGPCCLSCFKNTPQRLNYYYNTIFLKIVVTDFVLILKIVSEHDQEIPQSQTADNPWHSKEEPHNNHETPERQTKQSNQLSVPHQDDCKTRMT